ncbi:MAG: CDP-diacylglycerol--glycerol-3-phosphate 3-phosphatidyltransferase [Candidatus Omnitrophica bacterium]|nr:CDP-diacylglycerol--glycerol-3-phosphate 3-phosphatidyltransferase [Candidatus Omnitrophota bacterium]
MTLPTKLSVLRIGLAFLVMAYLFVPGWAAKAAALALFLAACLTDWLDGFLARRWHETTPLGALLDPIADKVLVLGTFLAFVQLRLVPAWMVLIIALREFLITGIRLYMASRRLVLPAAAEGKHKTVSQMVAIVVILGVLVIEELPGAPWRSSLAQALMAWAVLGCLWVAVVLTVVSGAAFFWRHRGVLRDVAGTKR